MCIKMSHYDGALSNYEFYHRKRSDEIFLHCKTLYCILLRSVCVKHKKVTSTVCEIQTDQNGHARLFIYPHVRESKESDGSLLDKYPLTRNRPDVSNERAWRRAFVVCRRDLRANGSRRRERKSPPREEETDARNVSANHGRAFTR